MPTSHICSRQVERAGTTTRETSLMFFSPLLSNSLTRDFCDFLLWNHQLLMHWQRHDHFNSPRKGQPVILFTNPLPKRQVHDTHECFFRGWDIHVLKWKLACITAMWPPAAEWSLSMMKHQTHSRPLITNGLTGNDDDNARVCTLSLIAISLLFTFIARPGKYSSANLLRARPQTFLSPVKTGELDVFLARGGSLCFLAMSRLLHLMFLFLDFFLCCPWTVAQLCFRHGDAHTWKQTPSLLFIGEFWRDGDSGSGQELRWSESSDLWPHFFSTSPPDRSLSDSVSGINQWLTD